MPRPSEDELIARYLAPLAGPDGLGLRDDAAIATPAPGRDLVVTKDMLVAGVHFFADDPPGAIARKALRVNLSDLAAKAARPIGFLLGLALPEDWTEDWLAVFTAGLGEDAAAFGCPLLGGDTVVMPGPLTLSITAFGEVPSGRMVPRTGTRAGDLIYVTGTIGDAALGLELRTPADAGWIAGLDSADIAWLRDRYLLPRPRLGLIPALSLARAAMDVSDGFLGDLGKMLALEGLTTEVRLHAVPLSAPARAALARDVRLLARILDGGDDYEIVMAVAPDQVVQFEALAEISGLDITQVGIARPGNPGVTLRDRDGSLVSLASRRFQHFV